METICQHSVFRRVLGGVLFAGSLVLAGDAACQSAPEPPLPAQASGDARRAAAAVQAPKNVRPPPPVPSPIPVPPGLDNDKSAGSSPIPPQIPESAAPPARSPGVAPAPQLPTGFTSKVTTSTSGSGQFKVYGKDLQTRGPFSSRCDEIAERLKKLLRDDEPWVLPVVVAIKTPPDIKLSGPAVSTSISQITNGGFHLQVTVQVRPDLRPADIDAEITRILIAERILRNQKEITTKRSMVLPEWLLTGITHAMSFRDRSRPSAVFAAIFRSGKIYGIEEILDVAPGQLDALSRTLYETSCCALVLALLDQTEGPMRLRKFLSMLAVDSRDDRALLNFCFPTLALSASSLNKWWSLQMASLATPSMFETLGPTETRKALAEALTLRYETTADSAPKTKAVIADADAPPADAPVDEEKKRGLIGKFLGAVGLAESGKKADEAKPEPEKAGPAEMAKTKPKAEAKPADEAVTEEKKRGIIGRMFGAGGSSADEPVAEPKEEKKTEPAAKIEPPKVEKPKPDSKLQPTKEAEKKPAIGYKFTKPAPEENAAEPKKRGFLGRMFGGGDASKPDEPPPEKTPDKKSGSKESEEPDKPDEKKKSAGLGIPADEALQLQGRLIAMGDEWLATATAMWADYKAARGREVIKLRLPFGKKKTEEADKPAEQEKPKEEKPAAAPTKKPVKSEAKSETAPKSKAKPEPARPKMVPVSVLIEDYAGIMKRKDRAAILDGTARALSALVSRASVLFRPVIIDYVAVVADLQNGKTKDVDQRLKALRARTAKVFDQAKAVQDHLDWFEASETKNYSGAFEDYLKLPAQLEKELPVRDDPLSKYLDALDLEFGR